MTLKETLQKVDANPNTTAIDRAIIRHCKNPVQLALAVAAIDTLPLLRKILDEKQRKG